MRERTAICWAEGRRRGAGEEKKRVSNGHVRGVLTEGYDGGATEIKEKSPLVRVIQGKDSAAGGSTAPSPLASPSHESESRGRTRPIQQTLYLCMATKSLLPQRHVSAVHAGQIRTGRLRAQPVHNSRTPSTSRPS